MSNGDLVLVGSDHCAFDFAGQKEMGRGDFTKIPNGMPGVEERAGLLWTHGVRTGRISPETFVAVLSTNQARVHGLLPRKGLIAPGADADIVVWDPELELTITLANRHNGNDYTPYEGQRLVGGPARVYVRGELAFHDGEVLAPPARAGSCRGRGRRPSTWWPRDAGRRAGRPAPPARARGADGRR